MGRLQYDRDALGLRFIHEQVGDLRGQSFLDLRAMREVIDDASQFGNPHDLSVGEIRDVGVTFERHQVMLAHRVERDVPQEDHFVVSLSEGGRQVLSRVFGQPAKKLLIHSSDSLGGISESFALGVFTHGGQNLSNGVFDSVQVHDGRKGYGACSDPPTGE